MATLDHMTKGRIGWNIVTGAGQNASARLFGVPMTEHDIPLNAIITPQELIDIRPRYPKPKGIYWEILPPEKIDGIPVLKARKGTKRTR